jgi:hypothetical protein
MKYIFSSLFFALLIFACADPETGTTDTVTDTSAKPVQSANQNCYTGLDSVEKKVFDILSHDFWVVTGYHKIGDKPASKINKGRWYEFRDDCTFTVGHFDKEITTGTWSLEQQGTHLKLDAENVIDDGLWRMQIKTDGSMMVFVGTEQYQTNSIQQRLENLLFTPKNPKEMGWQ